jgi:hypothetical protein
MTDRNASLTIAALLMSQMVLGYTVNFVFLAPLFGPPGYLETAAPHALDVRIGVVLGLVMHGLALGIAIIAWPIFRRHSRAMASWLLALATVGLAAGVLEEVNVMSMLSLSQTYANDAGAHADLFRILGPAVASSRNWAHYTGLIVAGGVALTLYLTLFRFALVPRLLAGFGILAVLSQLASVTRPLFGEPVVFPMLAPLGIAHLALVIWLVAKGFAERPASAVAA